MVFSFHYPHSFCLQCHLAPPSSPPPPLLIRDDSVPSARCLHYVRNAAARREHPFSSFQRREYFLSSSVLHFSSLKIEAGELFFFFEGGGGRGSRRDLWDD